MNEFAISEIMSQEVISCPVTSTLTNVVNTMWDSHCSCIVLTEGKMPIGIITERDVVKIARDCLYGKTIEELIAFDYITVPPVTIYETETLFEALVLTNTRNVKQLIVVNENNELKGVVTLTDLIKTQFKLFEQQNEIIENSVLERTKDLEEANQQLKALSSEDPLLGIGNRRAMEVDLEHSHASSLRYKRPYSIVLFDIDNFKKYNDYYGHQAGDKALRLVSDSVMEIIRHSDRFYRYGGEELLLMLPETGIEGGSLLAKRIIEEIEKLAVPHCNNDKCNVVTVSAGIACREPDKQAFPHWKDLIAIADKCLYCAKNNGRNQVNFELNPEKYWKLIDSE